ncbi:MAG: NADPH:quinone oxidoreductase family protein [Solirubrobacteraceae bacterium]
MRAIQMSEFGGPEVLKLVELPDPQPAAGEVLIRVTKAGVNFADTHTRTNSYVRKATLPLVPGGEVAGVREDTGERVVALTGSGGYAEYAVAPAAHVFAIPEGVDDGTALALIIQGTTAWHLYRTAGHVGELAIGTGRGEKKSKDEPGSGGGEKKDETREGSGETVVVHAAAGGVGSLAVQLGHPLGAGRVIATASSEDKRELALRLGADAAIDPTPEGLTERLVEANGGSDVDVVFDMSGGEVFDASYKALAPFGRIVVCGIASQQPNEVRSGSLLRHSRAVVGFYIFHCLERPGMFEQALADLFARVAPIAHPRLEVVVGNTYHLEQAARAHIDLRERRTTGKLLLDLSA